VTEGYDFSDGLCHGTGASSAASGNLIDIPATNIPSPVGLEDATEDFVIEEPKRTEAQLSDNAGDALRTSESLPEGASDATSDSASDSNSSDEEASTSDNKSDAVNRK
jgi:hypothetical protein